MICPTCGWDNLPGNEACANCQQDLTPLDRPTAGSKVEHSLMVDQVQMLKPLLPPTTIAPGASVGEAIALMLERDIGALLVVDDDGKLVGIFSERDLLKKVAGRDNQFELKIGDFMTRKPAVVAKTDTLAFALHKMDGGGYRHLPVVEAGKPIGVLSVRDMLRHITKLCRE